MALLKYNNDLLKYNSQLLKSDSTPPAPTGGYWVHYQTGVITPITLSDSNITDTGTEVLFGQASYRDLASEIVIPEGVNRLMTNALNMSPELLKLDMPSTMNILMSGCLGNTVKLAEITSRSLTPPAFTDLGQYVGDLANLVVYVPSAALTTYQTDTNWSAFASFLQPIP